MHRMSLALIVNPKCKQNRKDPKNVGRLELQLGARGRFFATRDEAALLAAARECKAAGVETIGIHGGDGTLHLTLTKLIHVYGGERLPRIAFLRGGTQNTIARSCDVTASAEHMLDYVLRASERNTLVEIERDIIRVGPRPPHDLASVRAEEREDVYGFIFGNGFVNQFLVEYYSRGEPSEWNAVRTLVAGCASVAVKGEIAKRLFRRFEGRVIVDGALWPAQSFTGVVASTIEQVGLGFRPFVRCNERPHSFHLLGITAGAMGFALELPKIRLGRPLNEKKILSAVCSDVVFEAEEPLHYMVDGDTREASNRLELGVGPRLRIVVPQKLTS